MQSLVLKNQHILVAASAEKTGVLESKLSQLGATVFTHQAIGVEPATNNINHIDVAFSNLSQYNQILFTSSNAIKYYFYWLDALGYSPLQFLGHYATVGQSTATVLKQFGYQPSFVGTGVNSNEFAQQLLDFFHDTQIHALWPSANVVAGNLESVFLTPNQLTKLVVYNTSIELMSNKTIENLLQQYKISAILFLSPSSARSVLQPLSQSIDFNRFCCITLGQTTAETLKHFGIHNVVIPQKPNIDSMIETLINTIQNS